MSLSPYVPTDYDVIDEILEMLDMKPNELLCDIGSGDGRILTVAANEYHTRGMGVEINPILYEISKDSIKEDGLEDRIKIVCGDALNKEIYIGDSDAVTMYLTPDGVNKLKDRLESQLKPECSVLSKDYSIDGWKPKEIRRIPGSIALYLYGMDSI